MKILSKFLYNINQGFKGILSNKTMSFISIGSVSASLIILGIVISIVLNVNNFIETTKDEVNEIRAIVNSNLNTQEIENIKEELKSVNGVNSVKYQTKELAFDDMKDSWGEDSYLLEGMENPLDNYFIVKIQDSNEIKSIGNKINKVEGILSVNYHQDVMENFLNISNTVKKVGSIIIICLFIVCLFMISNTIRSRVYSKKEEIKIMKYVGASNGFVRAPFLIEGFIIGTIGATIATLVAVAIYGYVHDNMGSTMSLFANGGVLIQTNQIAMTLALVFLLIGMVIGIIGSAISVKKHLKV
ncbi:MAG: permease-like cell division protein FtsX [Paraclostridium sp.]